MSATTVVNTPMPAPTAHQVPHYDTKRRKARNIKGDEEAEHEYSHRGHHRAKYELSRRYSKHFHGHLFCELRWSYSDRNRTSLRQGPAKQSVGCRLQWIAVRMACTSQDPLRPWRCPETGE